MNKQVVGIQYGTCVRGRGRSQRMKKGSKRVTGFYHKKGAYCGGFI